MWLSSFLVVVLLAERAVASPEPGLLRIPKVYNAVITSNQNLAPSRAYPVIQPVVHRTAIGYVPPYYYTQIAPGFVGPEVVPLDPGVLENRSGREGRERGRPEKLPARPDEVESVESTDVPSGNSNDLPPKKISLPNSSTRDFESSGEFSSAESSEQSSSSPSSDVNKDKKEKNDRVPLSFYPNYQSLYYDPYFYPYNALPPHLAAPGTYYVDYPQPPGILGPLPPPLPLPLGPAGYPVPGGRPEAPPQGSGQESSRSNEKQSFRSSEKQEKIPDVPPPPLPATIRKKAS